MTKGRATREQGKLREDVIVRFQAEAVRSSLQLASTPKATGKRKESEGPKIKQPDTGKDIRDELQEAVDWFYRKGYIVATHHPLEPVAHPDGSVLAPDLFNSVLQAVFQSGN